MAQSNTRIDTSKVSWNELAIDASKVQWEQPQQEKSVLDAIGERFTPEFWKSRAQDIAQVATPEFWQGIGKELTSFPSVSNEEISTPEKVTPEREKQLREMSESAVSEISSISPVTAMAKAARAAIAPMASPLQKATETAQVGQQSEAIKQILKAFRRDKITPADVIKKLDELGPNSTIADVGGENVRALARATASTPGPGKEIATEVLNQRQFGQSARVTGEVGKKMGSGELFYENVENLLEARAKKSGPLYEKAVNKNNLIPEKSFDPIANDGFIMGIIDKIKSDPLQKMGGLPDRSMPVLDAAKKYIDDMIGVAKRGGEANKARLLQSAKAKLVDIADDAFPKYKTARDAYAGPTELINAMDEGRAFLRGDSEATKSMIEKMTESERAFFRIGAARSLRDKVLNTPDTADTVKKIFNTPLMREKLEVVFPSKAEFDAFEKMMKNEATLFQTRSAVLAGSRTAPLQAEMADVAGDVVGWGKVGYDVMRGNLGTAATGAARRLRGPGELSPETSEELANLLFATGEKGKGAVQSILTRRQVPAGGFSEKVPVEAGRLAVGATATISQYQDSADDIKARMNDARSDKSLSNRERRKQLTELKSEMNDLFKDAGKSLERDEFREFRKSVGQ